MVQLRNGYVSNKCVHVTVEDDEDDLSNVSDYEEEDMKSSFNYSLMNLRATSAAGKTFYIT